MFVELRVRTNLSFLTGASDTHEYINQAVGLGMPAIAITDQNGVYGLPRALEAIRQAPGTIKLICGADIKIEGFQRVTLLVKDRSGWGLLCRIITELHRGKEKGQGYLTNLEFLGLLDRFDGVDGLFCIVDLDSDAHLDLMATAFPGQTYLALTRYCDGMDRERTTRTKEASERLNLPIVATNDVHYHIAERQQLHDSITAVRLSNSVDDMRVEGFFNGERYLKSELQMRALFYDLPEAIHNTSKIADECSFKLTDLKYQYPEKFVPPDLTSKEYLEKLCFEGAIKRYGTALSSAVSSQLRKELDFVFSRSLEHFFLTNYDICSFARSANIYYNARGSAVNSIICFCLHISGIDPIRSQLYFSRFLNTARHEPPDIDIDFEHERREEVIQWIFEKYGRNHAAMVSALQTYGSDGAIVDLSKALGANVGTVSAQVIMGQLGKYFGDKIHRVPMLKVLTEQILESPRHISTHPGGFFLSHEDICTVVPVEPARMENRTIIQWDKNDLETLGLMKVDILSIGFLTVMHKACDLVGITSNEIPYECRKTFDMIGRGETHGTFQLESRAQINTNQRSRPRTQYDLVIGVSIVRPLASVGGMVVAYLKGLRNRMQGIPFKCGNADIEKILGKTCGIPLFQEQMMQIASQVAGFTDEEAEQLRKTLGKYRSSSTVHDMGKKLHQKLVEKGVSEEFSELLFKYVQGYSSYGFPESHAASYADLAYKSAWLKQHHPAELLTALINSQPMGFYSIDTLIYEAQRNGVRIMPIHPNLSDWDAKLESPNTVRMGFRNVRGISEEPVASMIDARYSGSFKSVEDFIARTKFNSDVIENLAMANVFECWRLDRRHTFWQTLEFHRLIKKDLQQPAQLSLIDERVAHTPVKNVFSEMRIISQQLLDYQILGYSPKGNPMVGLRVENRSLPPLTSQEFRKLPHQRRVEYAGVMTVLQRPPPAKGTAFMTLEDEFGAVDVIFKNEIYEQFKPVIRSSRFLVIQGRVQLTRVETPQGEFEMRTLLAHSCRAFAQLEGTKPIRAQQHPRALGKLIGDSSFSGLI